MQNKYFLIIILNLNSQCLGLNCKLSQNLGLPYIAPLTLYLVPRYWVVWLIMWGENGVQLSSALDGSIFSAVKVLN
jgi:hypothetical protein